MTERSEVGSRKSDAGEFAAAILASRRETAPPASLPVMLVGDAGHGEFRSAIEMLERYCELTIARDLATALDELRRAASAASLMVIAQTRPGEHSAAQLDALRRAAPLAPFVNLLGSLCEGESRSGSPWPGAARVYWHQWRQRALPELAALRAGRTSSWSLPATASDEERLLCSASEPFARRQGLVAIASENFEMADWLAGACREQGFAAVRTSVSLAVKTSGVAAVLWDSGLAGEANASDLTALQGVFPGARVIALLDFPRIEHYERLLAAGAAAVLSKPVMLAELFGQLEEAASY